jgi:RNA polymerase sigma factor (sigma-70 family)
VRREERVSDDDTAPAPAGGDARLEQLVDQYGHLIGLAIRRVGGKAAEADHDDIAQGVRVALWRRLQGEQSIDHPPSYVYKAAVRETVRALARLRARALTPLDEIGEEPSTSTTPADRLVEAREQREALASALQALSEERAQAVRGHLAGLSVGELMRLRGWSYQRARNLVARGMADLRTRLRERGLR